MGNLDGLEHALKIVLCRCADRHAGFSSKTKTPSRSIEIASSTVHQLQLYGYVLRREKAVVASSELKGCS